MNLEDSVSARIIPAFVKTSILVINGPYHEIHTPSLAAKNDRLKFSIQGCGRKKGEQCCL